MVLHYLFHLWLRLTLNFLDIVTDWLFGWWHGKPKELPPITNPLLLEPAVRLAAQIRSRQVKSVDVVQAYIARIKEVQPIINAMIDHRFYEAIEEAKQVDALIESGEKTENEWEKEKPFLGVPLTTKEAIGVVGLLFTSGVVTRKGVRALEDAAAIKEMKKAGAIVLGVTNVPEYCYWLESSNNLYGTTRNPYHTSRNPGGSSGGEGALISSAGSVIGVGSDLGGSIRIPSFNCGIFGHKPSRGIVSNKGQFPDLSEEIGKFNTVGPMCRYACDLVPMLKVLAGANAHKLKLDSRVDFRKLKVYYMEGDGGNGLASAVDPDLKEAQRKVIRRLEASYGIKPQKVFFKEMEVAFKIWTSKMMATGEPSFASVLAEGKGEISLIGEFLKYCLGRCEHTIHALFLVLYFKLSSQKDSEDYNRYLKMFDSLEKGMRDLLGDDGVFVYPTLPAPAQYFHQSMHRLENIGYTGIFNVLGLPSTQCPLGLNRNGLPIGVQIVSGLNNDRFSLALAAELEEAFGGWVSP